MELESLRKKLSTYKTKGGYLRNVSDEVLMELLSTWENWTDDSRGFYQGIGANRRKVAALLGKAKKMKREGYQSNGFQEIKIETPPVSEENGFPIEIIWENRPIRFQQVDSLVDFLKKAA